VIGKRVPVTLLYKGQSKDLQDSWVEEVEEGDDIGFGSTPNGWTNDAYGMRWLQDVFEPHTMPLNKRTTRLLIIDSHSSYINLQFIKYTNNHRIIILILPL
jgi:hypothetical protein